MQFSGAVEATKTLRARERPIEYRADVARQIIDGSAGVMLPRRKLVVLEWVFDMFATDVAASTCEPLWQLLESLWSLTADNGRRRIYKNHKFVANLAAALTNMESPTLVEAVARALRAISSTMDLLAFASDTQTSQLILAYLKSTAARDSEVIGEILFKASKSRSHIFGSKVEPGALDILLLERAQVRRLHYLRDYCSEATNSPIPSSDSHVEDVMQAVCESDTAIAPRFHQLVAAFPQWAGRFLEVLVTLRPREVSSELVDKLVSVSLNSNDGGPDWKVMELCMHIDAAPVLKHTGVLMNAGPTDHVIGLLISRSAVLRSLPEFLSQWVPQAPPTDVVKTSLSRALESLPPTQIAPLLVQGSPLLDLLVTSLTYKAAGAPQVRTALQTLLSASVDLKVKFNILELAPSLEIPNPLKQQHGLTYLRDHELSASALDLKSVVKRIESDSAASAIVLRFYTLLETTDASKYLRKLLVKCGSASRLQLTRIYEVYEHRKVTDALVETLIDLGEFTALKNIPKQVLAWNQRHRIVDSALKSGNSDVGGLVIQLLDSANPPEAQNLAFFLSSLEADDVSSLVQIVKPLIRHHEYIKELIKQPGLSDWQLNCIVALSGDAHSSVVEWVRKEYLNSTLRLPVLEVLNLLPSSPEMSEIIEQLAIRLSSDPPSLLFQLVCRRHYHWSIVTALFAYSKCQFRDAYTAYCRELSSQQVDCLVMAAADEDQYGVLQCLAAGRVFKGAQHANILTVVLAKCYYSNQDVNLYFIRLCGTVIREQSDLVTPFGLELILAIITRKGKTGQFWDEYSIVLSHVLLLQRRRLRGRMHLAVGAMTSLLESVDTVDRAGSFVRLVETLCSPPQHYLGAASSKEELNSAVSRDRRHVARSIGVLLQNYILAVLSSYEPRGNVRSEVSTTLRPAAFTMMDILKGNDIRSVAAGLDTASRTYLRSLYEDYVQNARWTSD